MWWRTVMSGLPVAHPSGELRRTYAVPRLHAGASYPLPCEHVAPQLGPPALESWLCLLLQLELLEEVEEEGSQSCLEEWLELGQGEAAMGERLF